MAAKDEDGRAKLYADIAHPINSSCREMIQNKVIEAFDEEKSMAASPDYISNYDDFDHDDAVASQTTSRPSSVEPAHVQQAEPIRGPHTSHSRETQSIDKSVGSGFGDGVFE